MDPRVIRIVGAISLTTMIVGCGSGAAPSAPAADGPTQPAPSADTTLVADIDVGGRTIHLVCLGPTDTGRPTVVFEHGLGGDSGQWADVITEIATTDRGCSYDRAGAGMSEPATGPRTTADQVEDLRTALQKAGVAPPYLLVGHSIGGWNALVHDGMYPADVVGAVLVDVRPPEASARWLAALPPEAADESEAIRGNREEFTTFETDPTRNPETLDLSASAAQAAEADLGDDPIVVLVASRGKDDFWAGLEPALATTMDEIWMELQQDLADRSTNGTIEMVEGATHDVPGDRPDAIVDAIRSVLAQLAAG
ncbi:MAG: alpha/beta hydrolase [Candidatus Limnocylindrales bacterium]